MAETKIRFDENTKAYLIIKDANGNEHELPAEFIGIGQDGPFEPMQVTFRLTVAGVLVRDADGNELRPLDKYGPFSVESVARWTMVAR